MIDKTSRHFRWFLRQMTKRAVLYTEMVTAPAIIHGRRDLLLDFDPVERPLVLQVGGDDPDEIARAITIAEAWDYDEYNLNVGCPSDKVQQGRFGACLMADPGRVAAIMSAMAAATRKPVSVKHRVGIEGFGYRRTSYEEMLQFVDTVTAVGAERFIVHARIAMLEGLSPKENRSVPPIRYEDVWRLKAERPGLRVEVNGQIKSLEGCREQLEHGMDGIMIGRASYEDPGLMASLDAFEEAWLAEMAGAEDGSGGLAGGAGDRAFRSNSSPADRSSPQGAAVRPRAAGFPLQSLARDGFPGGGAAPAAFDRRALVLAWADYVDLWKSKGLNPRSLVWPILELFPGVPGSRRYKQVLSQPYLKDVSVAALARQALGHLPAELP
jgi:tRNA-dihydrouridine synthase A